MTSIRKHRTILLATLVASVLRLRPAMASAHVGVGIGFGFWGPPVYPYGYWGYPGYGWGPYGYPYPGPYGYPYGGYYGGYGGPGYGHPLGQVKIKSPEPDAEIYINGSLAGRAHDLKHFYLRPGTYKIEQRFRGDVQRQRVYVLANRTVKIEFGPPGEHEAPPPPPPPEGEAPPEGGYK